MKLDSRFDIEAPLDRVYAELVDFAQWERAAMRRGTEVNRTDRLDTPGPGMSWAAQFHFRGKERHATFELQRMEPATQLVFAARSAPADLDLGVELVALSLRRTRMNLALAIQPKSLAAKLYVQSLRLARVRAERSFRDRMNHFVLELEERIRRQ